MNWLQPIEKWQWYVIWGSFRCPVAFHSCHVRHGHRSAFLHYVRHHPNHRNIDLQILQALRTSQKRTCHQLVIIRKRMEGYRSKDGLSD